MSKVFHTSKIISMWLYHSQFLCLPFLTTFPASKEAQHQHHSLTQWQHVVYCFYAWTANTCHQRWNLQRCDKRTHTRTHTEVCSTISRANDGVARVCLFMYCKSMCSVINVPWFMCTYAKVCSFLCLSSLSFHAPNTQNCTHPKEWKKNVVVTAVALWVPFILSFTLALLLDIHSTHFPSLGVWFCCCVHSLLLATLTRQAKIKKATTTPKYPERPRVWLRIYQVKFMWSIMPYNKDEYKKFPYYCWCRCRCYCCNSKSSNTNGSHKTKQRQENAKTFETKQYVLNVVNEGHPK